MKNKKNIIYLCNTEKGASGGAKIIYHHSEIINNLKGYSSQIVHIKKKKTAKWKTSFSKRFNINPNQETGWQLNQVEAVKNFKYDWFKNNVSIKDNLKFNKKNDFVILPEIFAHLADDLLIKNKIKYGIFVQNGYSIFFTSNQKKLFKAYSKANFILSYSEMLINDQVFLLNLVEYHYHRLLHILNEPILVMNFVLLFSIFSLNDAVLILIVQGLALFSKFQIQDQELH